MPDATARPSTDDRQDIHSARAFYIAGAALVAASLIVRLLWYPVVTTDYTYFIQVWFETLASSPGLSAFVEPFADYAPLYLYILKALALVPLGSLVLAKTLSLAFDVLIAWAGTRILARAERLRDRPHLRFFAGAVLFALPTVAMNSSLWGQSDALYGASVLLTLLAILASTPLAAVFAFGIAISFKVQAIFFAPILIGWLARRREIMRYAWVPPAVFIATVIPAWLAGGNLWHWLFIYVHQAREYPWLSVSAQSIFAFVEPYGVGEAATAALFWLGILLAGLAAGVLAWYVRRVPVLSPRVLVVAALASVLVIPYLLPRMHERYFFLADLLAVVYAFFNPSRAIVAVLVVFASLISYMSFLSEQVWFLSGITVDLRIPAALLLIPIAYVAHDLLRAWRHARLAQMEAARTGAA